MTFRCEENLFHSIVKKEVRNGTDVLHLKIESQKQCFDHHSKFFEAMSSNIFIA